MKYLAILILLIISIDLKSHNESVTDLIKYKIDTFNINHQEDFKRIILENFPEITKAGLDTVKIIANPYFEIHPFAIFDFDIYYWIFLSDYIEKKAHYRYEIFRSTHKPVFLKSFVNNKNIFQYLIGPIFELNQLKIWLRIYNLNNELIYSIYINKDKNNTFSYSAHIDYHHDIIRKYNYNFTRNIPYNVRGLILFRNYCYPELAELFLYNNILYVKRALYKIYPTIPWYNLYQFDERCQFVNYYK